MLLIIILCAFLYVYLFQIKIRLYWVNKKNVLGTPIWFDDSTLNMANSIRLKSK